MFEVLPAYDRALRPRPSLDRLWSPARPALQVASALDQIRRAPSILDAMRSRDDLLRVTFAAVEDGVHADHLLEPFREAITDGSDTVAGLAAVHALALVPGSIADAELAGLVFDAKPGFEEHATLALAKRAPSPWLVDTLSGALARGGATGMHAQSALSYWAATEPEVVLVALKQRFKGAASVATRRHIVETIGLVPGRAARLALEQIATDPSEAESVRATAIAAFVERGTERLPRSVGSLATEPGPIGDAVQLVRAQRGLMRRGPRRAHDRSQGLRVAQIHLGAVLDESASMAGVGDTGGVATLLSQLGRALAAQPRLAEVISIGRAAAGDTRPASRSAAGHRFEYVSLESGEGAAFASAWPSLVAAQRGIRSALLATGIPDVVHLRMSDPGSLAGALVAHDLGIPTVFTLAPDPHGPIADAERRGALTRRVFAQEDARAALWLRADLVGRLAAQARGVVLFPRPNIREQLHELVGVDISDGPPRYTVVAEGVDTHRADLAAAALSSSEAPSVLIELEAAVSDLPARRHGLPLAVTVGRMHELKGMARIVAAFAADPELAATVNLVIIGGDLAAPTPAEAAELARIETIFESEPALRDQVILLGHRPNEDVSLVLAAARAGWGQLVAKGGAYVCGSRKEEFGLAIVEAMAAGLPVVAPRTGGPASYVESGVTGTLVDTGKPQAIAEGLRSAIALASDEKTGRRARAAVDDRYTLDRMAQTLAAVYRVSTGASTLSIPVHVEAVA